MDINSFKKFQYSALNTTLQLKTVTPVPLGSLFTVLPSPSHTIHVTNEAFPVWLMRWSRLP